MNVTRFIAAAIPAMFLIVSCANGNNESRMVMPEVSEALKEYAPSDSNKELQALAPTKEVMDSASYLLGVNTGMMFKGQGVFTDIDEVNMKEFEKGLADALEFGAPEDPYAIDEAWAKQYEISPYQMNRIVNSYLHARRAAIAKFNEVLCANYLAANLKKEGVKQTESGLQYILHEEGEGDKVQPEDEVHVRYKGTLIDGTQFDANDSIVFQANRVIKGWTEGLGLLGKGGKATLFIPGKLAYGLNPPRGGVIQPSAALVFEVEVLDIVKPTANE